MAKIEIVKREPKKPTTTPPAPAPAEPAKEPEPAPTPEELAERQEEVIKSMGWEGLVQPDKAKTDEPKEPAKDAEPPAEPTAKEPEATKEPVTPPAAAVTKEDVEAAAKRAAELVAEQRPLPAPAPAPAAPAAPALPMAPTELSPDDRKDYDTIAFLEQTQPDKYKGRTQAFLQFTKDYYAYQDAWSAKPENQGQVFDPESDEHATWLAKHDPGTSDKEIEEGRELMLEERVYNNRLKPVLDQIKQEQVIKETKPIAIQNVALNTLKVVEAVNPELAKLLKDDAGNPSFTKESIAAVGEADPIAASVLQRLCAAELEPMVYALEMSVAGVQIKDPRITQIVSTAERDKLKAPAAERSKDGKTFTTIADFNRMDEAQRQQHYTLTVDDIEEMIVAETAKKAKALIEDFDNVAKAKYKPGDKVTQSRTTRTTEPQPNPPPPSGGKPRPPSTSTSGDTARTSDQPSPNLKKYQETMVETMYKSA